MPFNVNKYLQHYQAKQKEHSVVKQSRRLVGTVLEVIIKTYLIFKCTHTPLQLYSLNHKITTCSQYHGH